MNKDMLKTREIALVNMIKVETYYGDDSYANADVSRIFKDVIKNWFIVSEEEYQYLKKDLARTNRSIFYKTFFKGKQNTYDSGENQIIIVEKLDFKTGSVEEAFNSA